MLLRTTLRPAGACASRKLCHLQAASALSVYAEHSVGATGPSRVHLRKRQGDFRAQLGTITEVPRSVSQNGSRRSDRKVEAADLCACFHTLQLTADRTVSRPYFRDRFPARRVRPENVPPFPRGVWRTLSSGSHPCVLFPTHRLGSALLQGQPRSRLELALVHLPSTRPAPHPLILTRHRRGQLRETPKTIEWVISSTGATVPRRCRLWLASQTF